MKTDTYQTTQKIKVHINFRERLLIVIMERKSNYEKKMESLGNVVIKLTFFFFFLKMEAILDKVDGINTLPHVW